MEVPEEMAKKRYCFPAKAFLTGPECCRVQEQFAAAVLRLQENPATRSMSATYDALVFLPLKTFFILIVVAIGIVLTLNRDRIDQHYGHLMPQLERGVIIGAFAMLFWPAMDYGYQQTANALFGRCGYGSAAALEPGDRALGAAAALLLPAPPRQAGRDDRTDLGRGGGRRRRAALRAAQRSGRPPVRDRAPTCGC